jgi:hypothetical protein
MLQAGSYRRSSAATFGYKRLLHGDEPAAQSRYQPKSKSTSGARTLMSARHRPDAVEAAKKKVGGLPSLLLDPIGVASGAGCRWRSVSRSVCSSDRRGDPVEADVRRRPRRS